MGLECGSEYGAVCGIPGFIPKYARVNWTVRFSAIKSMQRHQKAGPLLSFLEHLCVAILQMFVTLKMDFLVAVVYCNLHYKI